MGLTDSRYWFAYGPQYEDIQRRLLPRGRLWESAVTVTEAIEGLARQWAAVHNRVLDLLEEADPRSADELLSAWEECYGLPGPCTGLAATVEDRRLVLHAKRIASGGSSRAYFISLAAALGLTVTIDESARPFRVGARVGGRLYGTEWQHVWTVVAPTAASGTDVADSMECLFGSLKPAHTRIVFSYTA
jgi:uncharacterized protein YmfQ (DUF2313 family)